MVLVYFFVTPNRNSIQRKSIENNYKKRSRNIRKRGAFEHYHSDNFHKITNWIEQSNILCPLRHTFDWGKQTAHQDKDNRKKPCNKHCLLLGIGVIGDNQPNTQNNQQIY